MKGTLTLVLLWLNLHRLSATGNAPVWVVPTAGPSAMGNKDENVGAGIEVLILFASDDENDVLTYSIESQLPASPAFTLDGAVLKTPAGLDAETAVSFAFTFSVSDGTSPTSSVEYSLAINDLNDNSPVFSSTPYSGSVTDGALAGDTVLTVIATDADSTASIAYSITAGNTPITFSMVGGAITVGTPANVDSTTTPSYTLTVTATDGTNPVTVSVTLSVTANFCSPNPCLNSGTCASTASSYTCTCASGFIGTTCSTADPCLTNPCQNSGTCAVSGTTYSCTCASGFSGTDCSETAENGSTPNSDNNTGAIVGGTIGAVVVVVVVIALTAVVLTHKSTNVQPAVLPTT